ncbi:MAG: hypothetical protein KAY24_09110 [Candidatus Eisenbacteria sp.]|nr:hypothetical protein [Candidatus Eisenbacteria bacterium]
MVPFCAPASRRVVSDWRCHDGMSGLARRISFVLLLILAAGTAQATSWTTYDTSNSPLPHNTVYSLVEDLTGAIWFGTSFGCARFDSLDWEVFTDLGGGATNVAVRGIDADTPREII